MSLIILPIMIVGGLGLIFGMLLAWLSRRFAVKVDPRIKEALELLPGSNCGACGKAGCSGFAEALVKNEAPIDGCAPGGEDVRQRLAQLLGVVAEAKEREIAVLLCNGGNKVKDRFSYDGLDDCRPANLLFGGMKNCRYGCLGLGSCVEACQFGAIQMEEGLPTIDPELCTGCGRCVDVCPKDLITLIPASKEVVIRCSSKDKGVVTNQICEVGCIACQKCVKSCEFGAITVRDNLARIDYVKCRNCGKCIEACPKGTIGKVAAPKYKGSGLRPKLSTQKAI